MAKIKNLEDLLKGIRNGDTINSLAAAHGISRQRVEQVAILHGIPNMKKLKKDETFAAMVIDIENGMTVDEITATQPKYTQFQLNKIYFNKTGVTLNQAVKNRRNNIIIEKFREGMTAKNILKDVVVDTAKNKMGSVNHVYLITRQNNEIRSANTNDDRVFSKVIKKKYEKDGLSFTAIAEHLNKKGYRTLGGKEFSRETTRLYYTKMKETKEFHDIIVTLPRGIEWSEYEKELEAVADGSQVMNFRVRSFPKTKIGKKCYLVHRGFIVGWMEIVGLSTDDFTCTTTGKNWTGRFIQRSGEFHYIDPIPMKGFQGAQYMKK